LDRASSSHLGLYVTIASMPRCQNGCHMELGIVEYLGQRAARKNN
jgi:hypothetical protein